MIIPIQQKLHTIHILASIPLGMYTTICSLPIQVDVYVVWLLRSGICIIVAKFNCNYKIWSTASLDKTSKLGTFHMNLTCINYISNCVNGSWMNYVCSLKRYEWLQMELSTTTCTDEHNCVFGRLLKFTLLFMPQMDLILRSFLILITSE